MAEDIDMISFGYNSPMYLPDHVNPLNPTISIWVQL